MDRQGFNCVPFSPGEEAQYLSVVESGLLTVLDLAKTAPQQSKLDQISLLLAIKGETVSSAGINWGKS